MSSADGQLPDHVRVTTELESMELDSAAVEADSVLVGFSRAEDAGGRQVRLPLEEVRRIDERRFSLMRAGGIYLGIGLILTLLMGE